MGDEGGEGEVGGGGGGGGEAGEQTINEAHPTRLHFQQRCSLGGWAQVNQSVATLNNRLQFFCYSHMNNASQQRSRL